MPGYCSYLDRIVYKNLILIHIDHYPNWRNAASISAWPSPTHDTRCKEQNSHFGSQRSSDADRRKTTDNLKWSQRRNKSLLRCSSFKTMILRVANLGDSYIRIQHGFILLIWAKSAAVSSGLKNKILQIISIGKYIHHRTKCSEKLTWYNAPKF